MARQMGINDYAGSTEIQQEFIDFYPMELNYGSKDFKQDENGEVNELSYQAMVIFAGNFHRALTVIAQDDSQQDDWPFWHISYHQSRWEDGTKPVRDTMRVVAEELQNGVLFTATVAGIKKIYTKPEFQTDIEQGESHLQKYRNILRENYNEIVSETNQSILNHFEVENEIELPNGTNLFNLDPDGDRALSLESVTQDLECFQEYFQCYYDDIDNSINKAIRELCSKVDTDLRKKFLTDNRDVNGIIFFDTGIEIRMDNDNSVLLNMDKAVDTMKRIWRTR
jgi:hypothetical protein